jgi:hypothetical protein
MTGLSQYDSLSHCVLVGGKYADRNFFSAAGGEEGASDGGGVAGI